MLQNPTEIVLTKRNVGLKPYQYILFNNLVKHDQYYEDIERKKDRSEKSLPNMQQVIQADIARIKTNQIHDRKLNRDLHGPKGLNWQCKQELQRLRNDERNIERDLIRLNHDIAKISSLNSISPSPLFSRNQTSRLAPISEEHLPLPIIEKPKLSLRRTSSMNPRRTSSNYLIPIEKRSSIIKTNPYNEQSHLFPKYSFQQIIAKTSDDHSYFQHHAQIINQQKRLVEQKLKQFLH